MSNLIIKKTLAIAATEHADGDCLGGEIVFDYTGKISGASDGVINAITIADAANQKAPMSVIFFESNPGGTYTDDAALDITDADLKLVIGAVSITADDYVEFADNAVATVTGIGLPVITRDSGLYCVVKMEGAATYAAVTDVQLMVNII